jgi:hypothetical protein
LDLHTDVNRYLKGGVQIPATFPQPVTLEHLMTHTPGFEDHVIGLFAESPNKMRPLAELMRTEMPRRVFPPGQVAAYSNYGTTLAALIVEQVSGVPYKQLKVMLALWAAAAVLTLVLLFLVILAWRRGWWQRAGRISLTLILLGGLGCILWLNHWNLLGWKY